MLIQTVSTISYLPFVAVMIDSVRQHAKDVEFSVLITDVSPQALKAVRAKFDATVELLCCEDLGFEFMAQMRTYYDVLEFNSACKALALAYQVNTKKRQECLFLDPDMYVCGDIVRVLASCGKDIVLTPHASAPYLSDVGALSDVELIMSGHINGGVIFFKKSSVSMVALEWLIKQVKFNWFVAPQYGLYADQQWLSLLPYYFEQVTHVCHDPALNIGYFNLHERELSESNVGVMVNSRPALLFHFSGFATPSHGRLSRHFNGEYSIGTEQTLKRVVLKYEELFLQQMDRFKGLKGDLGFCQDSLYKRMQRVKSFWKVKHVSFDVQPGRFERIGRKLDRLL